MTNPLSTKTEYRLRLRGIEISNDPEFVRMVPWTRATFLACGAVVGLATTFTFSPALWAMVPVAAIGALTPRHPFDAIYNHVIRRFTGTRELPENGAPLRFACAIAVPWLVATALACDLGLGHLGCVLGYALTAVAALVGLTHFCIPSAIYQYLFGDRRLIHPAIFGQPRTRDRQVTG